MVRVVYVNASLVRRTLDPVRSNGVGLSHAPEEAPIQTRAEAKYARVAALGEPKPMWNPARLSAPISQPVADNRENGPRKKLADVEGEKFIEQFGGKRKLREPPSTRAFREFAQRGDGHPEAKSVSVQNGVEAAEEGFSAAPLRSRPEGVFEAEAVPGGVEKLRSIRGFVLYFGSVRECRMPDIPDAARTAPVAHKTSALPSPGTANHTASTPDAAARITVSAETAQRRSPVA